MRGLSCQFKDLCAEFDSVGQPFPMFDTQWEALFALSCWFWCGPGAVIAQPVIPYNLF
jgi:hypothetical protein